ncbi:GIY-YIG nuclease family protein [bacterium]|nr:GIY-YIG nuclease family protein [bacterium]
MNNNMVYCHINKINGKRYIGITKRSLKERCGTNGVDYKKSTRFYNAIQKYGWDNFDHIILEENLTRKQASEREQYYINLYNTMNDRYGYNITSGGDDNFIRNPLTEEQKQLVSETTKKAMNEPKLRAHMLEVYKSDNWIKKNSDSAKNQWATTDLKTKVQEANGRKVKCIETGKQYMSILEASKDTGISSYKISQSCKIENYIADGTHWQFI